MTAQSIVGSGSLIGVIQRDVGGLHAGDTMMVEPMVRIKNKWAYIIQDRWQVRFRVIYLENAKVGDKLRVERINEKSVRVHWTFGNKVTKYETIETPYMHMFAFDDFRREFIVIGEADEIAILANGNCIPLVSGSIKIV